MPTQEHPYDDQNDFTDDLRPPSNPKDDTNFTPVSKESLLKKEAHSLLKCELMEIRKKIRLQASGIK